MPADGQVEALLLGIDPGLANTGWALIDTRTRVVACGTLRTAPGPTAPRLHQIATEVDRILVRHPVGEAALEELFMGRNATSAVAVAQARGAILAALAAAGVHVHEYKPSQVKAVLTGYGKADKHQMARVVITQATALPGMDDHAIDAAAIAICHARSRRLRLLTGVHP
jgi:crossover junction endodeoxyribonuclease RuvC